VVKLKHGDVLMDVSRDYMLQKNTLVHVHFVGKTVELLLEIDHPLYKPYVMCERGQKVLYVRLLKALYCTICAARLFYKKLTCKLQEWGFGFNQYDRCVANKMVDDNQLKVVWNVDDLKVSHKEVEVVDEFLKQLDDEFGKETPINKSKGRIHNYLGMVLHYTKVGCVKINMTDYIKMVLHDIRQEMIGTAKTPVCSHLFVVNEDSEKLEKKGQETYVHYVMQLLNLSQ
jgi:Reverse transcriptase (RNA-dependent DNA polymerase)